MNDPILQFLKTSKRKKRDQIETHFFMKRDFLETLGPKIETQNLTHSKILEILFIQKKSHLFHCLKNSKKQFSNTAF